MSPTTLGTPEPSVTRISDIAPAQIDWLWASRIARAGFTIVEGRDGGGKTTLVYQVIAAVTTGRASALPGNNAAWAWEPSRAVILSDEDDLATVVRPRLLAAGADVDKVFCGGGPEPIQLARLEKLIVETKATLLVLDPLSDYVCANINSAQALRRELGRLLDMAGRRGLTVVGIRHLSKSATSASTGGVGSYALRARARSVLVVASCPTQASVFAVASAKNNCGPKPGTLKFRIVGEAGAIEWLGETAQTADELVAPDKHSRGSAFRDATAFLQEVLSQGGIAVGDVKKLATRDGLAWATVRRAQDHLGVESQRSGYGAGSWCHWHLPGDERMAPTADGPADAQPRRVDAHAAVSTYDELPSLPSVPSQQVPAPAPRPAPAANCPPAPPPTLPPNHEEMSDAACRALLLELD